MKATWTGFRQQDRDPWEVFEEYARPAPLPDGFIGAVEVMEGAIAAYND